MDNQIDIESFGTINITPFKPENSFITFVSSDDEEILKICDNGDIIYKGELVDNNKAITDGLAEFLTSHKIL